MPAKMPLQSQFALSLELTRLVPLSLEVVGKTYEAAMKLARDLQNSGSDIVVEEDLATVFGRSKITDNIASSFRTVMSMHDPPENLTDYLVLYRGPGPTVSRALVEPAYFSTIVQCSFLTCMHEKSSLATVIAQYFEETREGAPDDDDLRAPPSVDSIREMLRACEDQTTNYNWQQQILAIGQILGIRDHESYETIPPAVLKGLMSMLPLVQRFPEDRYIAIETFQGAASIVAWAYLVLGIPIVVRLTTQDDEANEVRFPPTAGSAERILVHVSRPPMAGGKSLMRDAHISLLATAGSEELFTLREDAGQYLIDSTYRRSMRGLGFHMLNKEIPNKQGRARVLNEMVSIVCSFALCVSKALVRSTPEKNFGPDESDFFIEESVDENDAPAWDTADTYRLPNNPEKLPCSYSADQIFEAARMLFAGFEWDVEVKIVPKTVLEYVDLYKDRDLYGIETVPGCLQPLFKEWKVDVQQTWSQLRMIGLQLSLLVLALAQAVNIDECAEMPLSELRSVLAKADLYSVLLVWNGRHPLTIKEDAWLKIIALLMIGESTDDLDLEDTSLLSNRGWSVYVNSIGESDPYFLDPGKFVVKKGVPWRKGVSRHRIRDGPANSTQYSGWKTEAKSGDDISLNCAVGVEFLKPMIGDRDRSFLATLRLRTAYTGFNFKEYSSLVRRTGYREFWKALWLTKRTSSCQHPASKDEKLKLEPGWAAVSGFGDQDNPAGQGSLQIALTAGSSAARWRTLISLLFHAESVRVVLRGPDCCLACAAQQAATNSGTTFLVL